MLFVLPSSDESTTRSSTYKLRNNLTVPSEFLADTRISRIANFSEYSFNRMLFIAQSTASRNDFKFRHHEKPRFRSPVSKVTHSRLRNTGDVNSTWYAIYLEIKYDPNTFILFCT